MTLHTVLDRLTDIDILAQSLIRDTGMSDNCKLWDSIATDRTNPDESFLCNELNDLMVSLCRMHRVISYLQLPCSQTHTLELFPNGRYGYDNRTFSCGSSVEALIRDGDGYPKWVSTRIEHNGTDYYLYGYSGIPLRGLTIRERRCL